MLKGNGSRGFGSGEGELITDQATLLERLANLLFYPLYDPVSFLSIFLSYAALLPPLFLGDTSF